MKDPSRFAHQKEKTAHNMSTTSGQAGASAPF
jgi:hypothetical protein